MLRRSVQKELLIQMNINEFLGRKMVDIHKKHLPSGLKEGDAIRGTEGAYSGNGEDSV